MLQQCLTFFDRHAKTINRLLIVVIVAINGYVLLLPLQPAIAYQVKVHTSKPLNVSQPDALQAIDRTHNHVIIPRLRLDEPILDGTSPYLINKGIWRRPNTSTPAHGSNTVLVGHRFTYSGASILYNLDKMELDDDILVVWDHKLYLYKVEAIQTVKASEVSVEDPSADDRVTIYTCTPLWSVKNRLVVTGGLSKTL